MRGLRWILAFAILVGPSIVVSADHEESIIYAGGSTICRVFGGCVGLPLGSGLGGNLFRANGHLPVFVSAVDDHWGAGVVGVQACQDLDADGICTTGPNPPDAWVAGCGTLDLSTSKKPFSPALDTSVYISLVDTVCGVTKFPTTGLIALTYANPGTA